MKDKITKRTSIRFSIIERINYYFSDSLKKHNNSIESVKVTEKQSKETAPLSDFQSSYKGDNSPPALRAVARGDPKKGAWHKSCSLFCFAPCLALRSATTSCIEMVTTHSVRLFRPRVACPYESLPSASAASSGLKRSKKEHACAIVK